MVIRWDFSICLVGLSYWGCICRVFLLFINGSDGVDVLVMVEIEFCLLLRR